MGDSTDRTISETVRKLAGTYGHDFVYYSSCEVNSIDIKSRTIQCTILDSKTNHTLTAKLMAQVDDGLLIEPVIGSTVKVIYSDLIEPFVCQYSEIENITIHANTKITLNDGAFGGLVKSEDLTVKLNNIEKLLNDLIIKYNTHTHSVTATGAPTGPGLQPETGSITPTVSIDLQNQNVNHG